LAPRARNFGGSASWVRIPPPRPDSRVRSAAWLRIAIP
jgi:hypothetical protein